MWNGITIKTAVPSLIYEKCCNCNAPDRICNALVIYYKKMRNMDMEVVIINEKLGL